MLNKTKRKTRKRKKKITFSMLLSIAHQSVKEQKGREVVCLSVSQRLQSILFSRPLPKATALSSGVKTAATATAPFCLGAELQCGTMSVMFFPSDILTGYSEWSFNPLFLYFLNNRHLLALLKDTFYSIKKKILRNQI